MFASPLESVASINKFHSMAQATAPPPSAGGAWSLISVRTNIRNHFPKPREIKRITLHGFNKRMSTPSGRRIIMRRILQGRQILSH